MEEEEDGEGEIRSGHGWNSIAFSIFIQGEKGYEGLFYIQRLNLIWIIIQLVCENSRWLNVSYF